MYNYELCNMVGYINMSSVGKSIGYMLCFHFWELILQFFADDVECYVQGCTEHD